MIKLVIFDGESVLYSGKKTMEIFSKEYDKFLKKFGVSLKKQEELWLKLRPKMVAGKLTLREANKLIYKKLGIPLSKVDEWLKKDKQINLDFTKLIDNRKEVLLRLKKKGIKVAILSDTVQPMKWRIELLNKLGLRKGKHYDKVFLSNIIGYEKPHPKAYSSVLNYFKVRPEEAIFVGHDEEEIEGARKLGIKTIPFSSLKKFLNE